MKKISLGKLVGGILTGKEGAANPWRPEGKPYPRLADVDAESLRGRHGLFAVWHLGVRPQWLRVGAADDLGAALRALLDAPWIVQHQNNAGVFAAWAFVAPEQSAGMVRYLAETLRPAFQEQGDPVAVPVIISLPPGTR